MITTDSKLAVVERLAAVRRHNPELRFGQIVGTIGLLAEDETGKSLWDVENAELAATLERFAADLERRGRTSPEAHCPVSRVR